MAGDAGRFDERMTDTDALMWSIERDPTLRSTIASVLVLDRIPDRARLVDKVDRAARLVPRLRQRVTANTFSIAPPRWEVDPNFDLDYHLRFIGAPGAPGRATLDDLLTVAAPLAMSGFDLARPLWEMVVVEGMAGGGAAVIVKLHHTITDGVGAVELAMHLFDLEASPGDAGPMPEAPGVHVMGQWERMRDAWGHEQRRGLGIVSRALPTMAGGLVRLVWSPVPTVARVGEVAGSVGRALSPSTRPLSPVMTGRSLSARLDAFSVPLADAKAAAAAGGARINDFFLAGVLGGLRRYHDFHGSSPAGLRMGMPINVRDASAPEAGGNHFVPTRFVAPLRIDDPAERMRAVRDLVAEERAEPALELIDGLSAVARRMPRAAQVGLLGGLLRSVDVIASNVRGVPTPLYMAGAMMQAQYAFGPRSGAAVNVTLLSYLGQLFIGVNTDPAAVPDGDRLVGSLRDAFDELLELGRAAAG